MNIIHKSVKNAATKLQNEILEKTGLTISIGVGKSMFIAKLASDYKKPRGLTIVPMGLEETFVQSLSLKKLYGIGPSTLKQLNNKNINSVKDITEYSIEYLKKSFGKYLGEYLYKVARGEDPGIMSEKIKSHSISSEKTFYPDLITIDEINHFLLELSHDVFFRSLDEEYIPKTISIKVRYSDFTTFSLSISPESAIYNSNDVFFLCKKLFSKINNHQGIRLLGVSLKHLYKGKEVEQKELFSSENERQRKLEETILSLNKKGIKLNRASLIKPRKNQL